MIFISIFYQFFCDKHLGSINWALIRSRHKHIPAWFWVFHCFLKKTCNDVTCHLKALIHYVFWHRLCNIIGHQRYLTRLMEIMQQRSCKVLRKLFPCDDTHFKNTVYLSLDTPTTIQRAVTPQLLRFRILGSILFERRQKIVNKIK